MSKVFIRRASHSADNPYFLMLRETAQQRSLSWEARGVLAYILSKPDDWRVQPKDLEQNCARQKVYTILKELKTAGYVTQEQSKDKRGRFIPGDYVVYEQPCDEKPDTVSPDTVNQHITDYREAQNTEGQNTNIAPDGALVENPSPFKRVLLPDEPIFVKERVFDTLAFVCCGIKDMRQLRKPILLKSGKTKENPAGILIGKICAWLIPLYPEWEEKQVAAKVQQFYREWSHRRNYHIPLDLGKFIKEWLAWEQEKLPAPKLDSAPEQRSRGLLPGVKIPGGH
jgi:hypothetical protein